MVKQSVKAHGRLVSNLSGDYNSACAILSTLGATQPPTQEVRCTVCTNHTKKRTRRPQGKHYQFLALLCATAQQSYCRHAGVRRPSVRPSVRKPRFLRQAD